MLDNGDLQKIGSLVTTIVKKEVNEAIGENNKAIKIMVDETVERKISDNNKAIRLLIGQALEDHVFPQFDTIYQHIKQLRNVVGLRT